jgi:hypothetical protein
MERPWQYMNTHAGTPAGVGVKESWPGYTVFTFSLSHHSRDRREGRLFTGENVGQNNVGDGGCVVQW